MADNVTLNPGNAGPVVRTDEIAGVQVPVSKIMLGPADSDAGYVSNSNPLPIKLSADGGISQTVDTPQLPSALSSSGNLKVAIQEATFTVSATAAGQMTTTAYVALTGSNIDTANFGNQFITYRIVNSGANTGEAKVQASIDNTNWIDVTVLDETGLERATVDIALAAGAVAVAIVAPGLDNGAKSAFRFYRLQVRHTLAATTISALGFAK